MQGVASGGATGQQGGLTGSGVQNTAAGEAVSENREQGKPKPMLVKKHEALLTEVNIRNGNQSQMN